VCHGYAGVTRACRGIGEGRVADTALNSLGARVCLSNVCMCVLVWEPPIICSHTHVHEHVHKHAQARQIIEQLSA